MDMQMPPRGEEIELGEKFEEFLADYNASAICDADCERAISMLRVFSLVCPLQDG
ncbi:hypothetical protein [Nocardia asiatica]|uniref:hypothetical protein n=1 Tax=Nocardia asiatica TaxID=209252 RepID=UPI002454FE67|nr:hypothetical protein [Nocardia asiatica]